MQSGTTAPSRKGGEAFFFFFYFREEETDDIYAKIAILRDKAATIEQDLTPYRASAISAAIIKFTS